jgi:hypothetical protein
MRPNLLGAKLFISGFPRDDGIRRVPKSVPHF